jgi:hypothetical protein
MPWLKIVKTQPLRNRTITVRAAQVCLLDEGDFQRTDVNASVHMSKCLANCKPEVGLRHSRKRAMSGHREGYCGYCEFGTMPLSPTASFPRDGVEAIRLVILGECRKTPIGSLKPLLLGLFRPRNRSHRFDPDRRLCCAV